MKHREPLEEWETKLHRELAQLPELEAPSTLLPGVLGRIKVPVSLPWYQAAWWQWPIALRAASIVLVAAALGVLGWAGGAFGELQFGQQLAQAYIELKGGLGFALKTCQTVLGSSADFWIRHGKMILLATAALLMGTYLTCVAAGTALYQFAWRRF